MGNLHQFLFFKSHVLILYYALTALLSVLVGQMPSLRLSIGLKIFLFVKAHSLRG